MGVISASVGVILYLDDDPVVPANVAVATLEPAGELGPDPFADDTPIPAAVDIQPELEAPLDELSVPVVSTPLPAIPPPACSAAVGDAAATRGTGRARACHRARALWRNRGQHTM